MTHLVEFPLEEGGSIIVEVHDEGEERGTRRAARDAEGNPERAPQTYEQALSKIRPATEKVIMTLQGLIQKPDEVEMAFGFRLTAEAGVIIASANTQANYTETLRWKGESTENIE